MEKVGKSETRENAKYQSSGEEEKFIFTLTLTPSHRGRGNIS